MLLAIRTVYDLGKSNFWRLADEISVLLYSPPFLEDLAKGADRIFYFKEGSRDTLERTGKERAKK
ncbi:MAG: hypothetical protein LUQ38_07375 [Methanotrichaceae archaeon]|nr:hypothetical protein [Methanotrichaceae archaeon]